MEICNGCGQSIRKLNPHHMDKKKVSVLEAIAKLNLMGHQWVLVSEGMTGEVVVNTPYCHEHAARLAWFELIETQARRSGLYRVTEPGLLFLCGKHEVPNVIYCRDGVVVERSKELTRINQIRSVVLDKVYWNDYAVHQKLPSSPNQRELLL